MSNEQTNHVSFQLPDLIRGKLDAKMSANVRTHLSECLACQAEERKMRVLLGELDRLSLPHPPPGYFQTILPRVRERLEKPRWTQIFAKPLVGRILVPATAALVLGVAALQMFRSHIDGDLKSTVARLEAEEVLEAVEEDELFRLWNGGQRAVENVVSEKTLTTRIVNDLMGEIALLETFDPTVGSQQLLVSDLSDHDLDVLIERLNKKEIL